MRAGGRRFFRIGGVFEAVGHEPRSELFAGQLDTDPEGYVLVDPPARDDYRWS